MMKRKLKFSITKRLLDKYPYVRFIAFIVKNLPNQRENKKLEEEKRKLEKHIRKNIKDPSQIKRVIDYDRFYKKFSKTFPIEYQLKSIINGKEIPTVSTLVETMFVIELKHFCLMSSHDIDKIKDGLMFDISKRDEKYIKINKKEQDLKADDIVLRQGKDILASVVNGPDYYSRVREDTKNCLYLFWFVSKINKKEILDDFKKHLKIISNINTNIEIFEVKKEDNNMKKTIDPYGSELVKDYTKTIKEFGLDSFNLKLFPNPNRMMRRHILFGGRDLKVISDCIKNKKAYYVLSGIMPTAEKVHLGTKMVVENIKYFQEYNAKTYILVADLEAAAARGITLEKGRDYALNFHIPSYIAFGLDPKKTIFYFQSENKQVMNAAYEFAKKITLNEFKAIYGIADPGRIMSAVTQVADILYPQFKQPMPGIIPVGLDQDPHIRLTRDIVKRFKAKKFIPVSSIYHKYMPSLNGSIKMSKSTEESYIEIPEDTKSACKKIKNALTGGRDTTEEQRKLGGIPEKCIVFELYKMHLIEDDKELNEIYNKCKSGTLLCGECKQLACKKITAFMQNFEKRINKARKNINKLNFIKFE